MFGGEVSAGPAPGGGWQVAVRLVLDSAQVPVVVR
jgi:hypothetical protein